jgi:hypothetical protein
MTRPIMMYALSRVLLLFGAGCALIVVLTHIAEKLHVLPSMGWGLPNSPGHYLDLVNAILGGVSLMAALALNIAARYNS